MNERIIRSCTEHEREGLSWDERWRGPDKGLITCWEVGREWSQKKPKLAVKARNGELPSMGWKGGVKKETKEREKYGTLNYLAQWQGIRGDDLDIELSEEPEIVCSKTGINLYK